jgi:hypothetical protein
LFLTLFREPGERNMRGIRGKGTCTVGLSCPLGQSLFRVRPSIRACEEEGIL